ncbi:peptidoglycan glycosyltransferase [Vulcanimicrobium alpinum]|uniref:Peptidoglycan glycosyltransferase n=1 Tax=Vulcanimicrobium alpinum TaxID=3016050 RepID=A0AAN1XYB2_UNVUL|nr:penicillin-binding transpeptidase domain-containing protein [Vulcanimicrobium alpinum]BDE06487.1 peptidoglycan glycosyltransferase [Vulcanimicrobium alpinum]
MFALLAARQVWLQVIEGPSLAARPLNPRHAAIAVGRGSILASDGAPLARTRGARRVYPQAALTAQAVGYASSRYGTSGLEDAYDTVLTAHADAVDPLSQLRQIVSGGARAARGADVVTTLDLTIQRALVARLAQYPRAAGVVLDPRTGAVLALASIPAYDPNALDARWSALSTSRAAPLLDRSTGGLYPPGSTFKIYTAAVGLDSGVITRDSTFEDDGGLRIGNFTVRNDEEEVTGTQDLTGAFALSSNVDFAQIALRIGVDRWFAYAQRFGLGQSEEFDLPVTRDRIPAKKDVYDGILAQLGFGQASLLVTPMRMALIGATIANDGTTPRPYLVRRIAGSETALATRPEILAQPVSAETAHQVRELMIAVVAHGTGTAARLPGVTVAGKTGTATNPHGRSHAWFVAFAPARAPRVAVAVVVENVGYGGTYAAPIAREVLRVALARSRS